MDLVIPYISTEPKWEIISADDILIQAKGNFIEISHKSNVIVEDEEAIIPLQEKLFDNHVVFVKSHISHLETFYYNTMDIYVLNIESTSRGFSVGFNTKLEAEQYLDKIKSIL